MPFRFLERLFLRRGSEPPRPQTHDVAADDLAWLVPPNDTHDPAPWDVYWHAQVARGFLDIQIFDALSRSDEVIAAMRENGLRSVLFVGNGLAIEPRRYIEAGFDVTIMDLSPFAIEMVRRAIAENQQRAECVTGDLLDPTVCPGPFDVVIERRTLQLFDDGARERALEAVTSRVATPGLFVTHAHLGGWRPGMPRTHPAEKWLRKSGWPSWVPGTVLHGRAAWTYVSTG